jgi:hypothetical protein
VRDAVDWLLHEDQERLFEFLVALALGLLFLGLAVLLLWPIGRLPLVPDLAKGYGILWIAIWVTAALGRGLQRLFRMNLQDRSTAYVVTGLAISGGLQVGWSAFAAFSIHRLAAEASVLDAGILYLVGALSCLAAFFAVSSVYHGTLYRLVNLLLALLSLLVFSVWLGSSQAAG